MEDPEHRLRVLAGSDSHLPAVQTSALDAKTDALVRIAALVAVNAPPASYLCAIRHAMTVGASVDEVIATLVAVSTTVGLSRVVSATPGMAHALGFDIDAALEGLQLQNLESRGGGDQ